MLTTRSFLLCVTVILGGCSSFVSPRVETVVNLLKREKPEQPQFIKSADSLDPTYRYLLVQQEGGPLALLALGYFASDSTAGVEVWYSGVGEVFKFQSDRLIATSGLPDDLLFTRLPQSMPSWSTPAVEAPFVYQRRRAEMPGYQLNISEAVSVRMRSLAPKGGDQLPFSLPAILPSSFVGEHRWFSEAFDRGTTGPNLPDSWFAIAQTNNRSEVIFSRQCIRVGSCFQFLRWPLREPN